MVGFYRTVSLSSFMALLSACGGGGSTTQQLLQTTGLPVASAFESFFTTAGTYSATSVDGSITLTLTITPGQNAQFSQSAPVSRTTIFSTVLRQNGGLVETDQTTLYFNTSPLTFVAFEGRAVDASFPIPATADVNASSQAYFSAGSGRGLFSTPPNEGTWSIEQSNDRVFLCMTNKLGYGLLSSPGFEETTIYSYCFGINGQGMTAGFKATVSTDEDSTVSNSVVNTISFR